MAITCGGPTATPIEATGNSQEQPLTTYSDLSETTSSNTTNEQSSQWGPNPTTVQAAAAVLGLSILVIAARFGFVQLRDVGKAREAAIILELLSIMAENFLPSDTYNRLRTRCEHMDKKDWTETLDDDEVQLLKVIKLYDVAGHLVKSNMITPDIVVSFVRTSLLAHYRDFRPYFDPAQPEAEIRGGIGAEYLLRLCKGG